MKTSCKIIEDLLPMYHDEICSEESAALIEEHLKECASCSHVLASLRGEIDLQKDIPADDLKPLEEIHHQIAREKKLSRRCHAIWYPHGNILDSEVRLLPLGDAVAVAAHGFFPADTDCTGGGIFLRTAIPRPGMWRGAYLRTGVPVHVVHVLVRCLVRDHCALHLFPVHGSRDDCEYVSGHARPDECRSNR